MGWGARRVTGALALAMVGALAPACGEPLAGPTLVLTLASPDKPTDLNGPHVQHFVDEVARLSEGTIVIEPRWDVAAHGIHGWDQMVAGKVADGTYDLGLVPGRAWDELGVTSLRALDAPFLVTSTALLEDVLSGDLRDDLLSGLSGAGVVGLDLFPENLRHPVGYAEPLLGVEDFRDEVIRAPRSATTRRILESFGAALVVDDTQDPATQRGQEAGYGVAGTGIVTGNVVLFPKTETLVMDLDVRDRLRDDQWDLLTRAASNTREWLFDELPTELEGAADHCAAGGRIVTASPAQVDGLRRAAEQVTAELREDAGTSRLIEAIEALAASHPDAEIVEECPGANEVQAEGETAEAEIRRLDGIYTAVVTKKALRDAGTTDRERILNNAGRYTWTLDGGIWSFRQRADHFLTNTNGAGVYTYEDGVFTFTWDAASNDVVVARLDIAPDGSIRFRDVRNLDPALQGETEGFYSRPWTRVADLP